MTNYVANRVANRVANIVTPGGGGGSGFDPLTLSPAIWIEPSLQTGLVDGDTPASYTDFSGNAMHLSQATIANRFTYKEAILNGLGVMRADGNDRMDSPSSLVLNHPTTWIIVASKIDSNTHIYMNGLSGRQQVYSVNNHLLMYAGVGQEGTSALGTGFKMFTCEFDGGSSNAWIGRTQELNNVQVSGVGGDIDAGIMVGSDGSNFLHGDIAFLMGLPGKLSPENKINMWDYLFDRFGAVAA